MSRCLIYKVHTALQRQELFYHTVSTLSRAFKVFSNFFQLLGQPGRLLLVWSPLQATRLFYHISVRLSRTFFAPSGGFLFSHSSSPLTWKPRSAQGFVPCVKRLLIISDRPRIVNCFFQFFSSFFLDEKGLQDLPFFLLFSTRYTLMPSPFCQPCCSYPQYRKRNP